MKNQWLTLLGMMALLTLGFTMQSCEDQCQDTITYIDYQPIYQLPEEIRSSVGREVPRDLEQPGKIYLYGDWVLVNELRKGIHVIDNSNPSNPQNIAFINIPGNVDMAVKNNIMYVDNFMDLLALDISDPQNITVLHREENAFPYGAYYGNIWDENLGILIDYDEVEVTETVDCSTGGWIGSPWLETASTADVSFANSGGGSGGSVGIGGSMARFTLVGDMLYTVSETGLHPFDLSTATEPKSLEDISLNWGVETIFPYKNNLFIGTTSGMHIMGLDNPLQPNLISTYEHVQSCDPVVVQDDYAYVTLRSGNECQGFTNQLEVINIENLSSPQLESVYQMENPHGLGVDGNCLFVCEGEFGLKTLDIEDIHSIETTSAFRNLHAYDVIPYQNRLLVIGNDGLYQFSYDCESAPQQISVIPVHRPSI